MLDLESQSLTPHAVSRTLYLCLPNIPNPPPSLSHGETNKHLRLGSSNPGLCAFALWSEWRGPGVLGSVSQSRAIRCAPGPGRALLATLLPQSLANHPLTVCA